MATETKSTEVTETSDEPVSVDMDIPEETSEEEISDEEISIYTL